MKSKTSRKNPGEKEGDGQSGSLNFDLAHVEIIKPNTQASAGKKFTIDEKTGLIQLNTVDSDNYETKD